MTGNNDVERIVGEAVSQPTDEEQKREERRSALEAMLVQSTTEVQPEVPALTVDGIGLFALSDIHALKGKQKCGKTTALKVCRAASSAWHPDWNIRACSIWTRSRSSRTSSSS